MVRETGSTRIKNLSGVVIIQKYQTVIGSFNYAEQNDFQNFDQIILGKKGSWNEG